MRTITVSLGGEQVTVRQLPVGPMARWAEAHEAVCTPMGEMALAVGMRDPTPEQMARLAVSAGLLIKPREMLDAVCAYSPELEERRQWVEENAYQDELLAALASFFFGASQPVNGAATPPGMTT